MLNQLDHPRPSTMYGKKILELLELSLKLDNSLSREIVIKIGTMSDNLHEGDNWTPSQVIYTFGVTTSSVELGRIICKLNQLCGNASVIGESLELANQEGPGQRPLFRLTQKILTQSTGTDTMVRIMWSSMSFVEQFKLTTCYDGSTDILFWLKSREALCLCAVEKYGLHPIYHQESGTLTWILPPSTPSYVDLTLSTSPSPSPTPAQERRMMLEQGHRDFDTEDEENYPPAPESDEIYGTQWYH